MEEFAKCSDILNARLIFIIFNIGYFTLCHIDCRTQLGLI